MCLGINALTWVCSEQKAWLQCSHLHQCPLLVHHWENSLIFLLPLKKKKVDLP